MNKLFGIFLRVIAALEAERGYKIGGFALDEKAGKWKVIRPDGKFEPLEKTLNEKGTSNG